MIISSVALSIFNGCFVRLILDESTIIVKAYRISVWLNIITRFCPSVTI